MAYDEMRGLERYVESKSLRAGGRLDSDPDGDALPRQAAGEACSLIGVACCMDKAQVASPMDLRAQPLRLGSRPHCTCPG